MDDFIAFFENITSLQRASILFGGLVLFIFLENMLPFFQLKYDKWKHTFRNLFFTVTTIIVNFALAFVLAASSYYVEVYNFGFLQWVPLPIWAQLIVGLLLLDLLSSWLPHFLQHKVRWMWQFHLIHHTDKQLDSTSANRHHPGESVIRFLFTSAAVLIVGANIWLVFLYQSLSVLLSQFNHSNLKIPNGIAKVVAVIIVTPQMHRIHHHYRQPYSDSNYGNIFSFWDYLFGTYRNADNSKIVFGIDTHFNDEETDDIVELLKIPFKKYRPELQYDNEERL